MKRIFLAVIVVLLVITAVIGCSRNASLNGTEYNLYFANQEMNNLVVEKRIVEAEKLDEVAEKVVEELLKGPSNSTLRTVFTKNTKLFTA